MSNISAVMREARAAYWAEGMIALWYLRPSQLDVYELLVDERVPFVEAARRFGKTTSILCFVLEKLIQNPGWIARWCFPFKNQAREVLLAEITKLNKFAAPGLSFEYQSTDSVFVCPNGSKLFIRGVNEDRGESARGAAANIIVADEYGFWLEPTYVVKEALSPQLQNQDGRHFIKASTPPRDLGHLYYTEREEAARKGRLITKTIYDNEALSKEELDEIIEDAGGVESPSFQRERLCNPVSDPEALVIPEWKDDLEGNVIPDSTPRPAFFYTFVAGDSGFDDNTAFQFGYYDFLNDVDIVEAEIVIKGKTTGEIIRLAKLKEMELWGSDRSIDFTSLAKTAATEDTQKTIDELFLVFKSSPLHPRRRALDKDKQGIFDIWKDFKYAVILPPKADKDAAIKSLRQRVGQRKYKVKESCTQTRRQFKVGMWRDEKHTDFQRSDSLGHLDTIAAGVYFSRIVDRKANPYPAHLGLSHATHHIPATRPAQDQTEAALTKLFGGSSRGRR